VPLILAVRADRAVPDSTAALENLFLWHETKLILDLGGLVMPLTIDSDTVSRFRTEYDGAGSPGHNPSSDGVRDNSDEDAAPARLGGDENPEPGRITFTAKDRKEIEQFLHTVYPFVAGAISMRCEECGGLIGSCEDAWCTAATGVLISKWPVLAAKILGGEGPVNLDLIMLAMLTMQMAAAVAHHHIPMLRDREPANPLGDDMLQPQTPWQQ
jgi:hypothetical protein